MVVGGEIIALPLAGYSLCCAPALVRRCVRCGVVCAAAPALRYPGGARGPAAGARLPAACVLARRRLCGVGGCGALAARFALVRMYGNL